MDFDAALARVSNFTSGQVSQDDQLSLYGLFKQARQGDAKDSEAPSYFRAVAYAKFQAWKKNLGMSKDEAERQYVELVARLDPKWYQEVKAKRSNGNSSGSNHGNGAMNGTTASVPKTKKKSEEEQPVVPEPLNSTTSQSSKEKVRRGSLDRNFKAKLSNVLENALENSSDTNKRRTRPRGKSLDTSFLDSSFIASPFIDAESIGNQVLKLFWRDDNSKEKKEKEDTGEDEKKGGDEQKVLKRIIYSHLVGVGNARDLGGLPALRHDGTEGKIRQNLLVRCAHFNEANEEDAKWFLEEYKLKTIVDLRGDDAVFKGPLKAHFPLASNDNRANSSEESRLRFSLPLIDHKVGKEMMRKNLSPYDKMRFVFLLVLTRLISFLRKFFAALPILAQLRLFVSLERIVKRYFSRFTFSLFTRGGMVELYKNILKHGAGTIREALVVLTDESRFPVAFHCQFGKDRTGLLSALVLHAAGVPRDIITKDYTMSHSYVFETERGMREWAETQKIIPELNVEEWGGSKAEHISEALAFVDAQYGSLDDYLKTQVGLDDEWKRRVRKLLVE